MSGQAVSLLPPDRCRSGRWLHPPIRLILLIICALFMRLLAGGNGNLVPPTMTLTNGRPGWPRRSDK